MVASLIALRQRKVTNAKHKDHLAQVSVEMDTTFQVKFAKMVTTQIPMVAQRHALQRKDGVVHTMVESLQTHVNPFVEMATNMAQKLVTILIYMTWMGKNIEFNVIRCTYKCTIEKGFTCPSEGQACIPTCGDSYHVQGETCDDGNQAIGDGCYSTCGSIETGWTCSGGSLTTKDSCTAICGDGLKLGTEVCDDKNTISNDG